MQHWVGIIELSAWRAANEATGKSVAEPAQAPPAYFPADFVPVPEVKQAEHGIAALWKKWRLSETTLGRLAAFLGRAAGPKDMGEGDWETKLLPNGWKVSTRMSASPRTRLDMDRELAAYLRALWQQ